MDGASGRGANGEALSQQQSMLALDGIADILANNEDATNILSPSLSALDSSLQFSPLMEGRGGPPPQNTLGGDPGNQQPQQVPMNITTPHDNAGAADRNMALMQPYQTNHDSMLFGGSHGGMHGGQYTDQPPPHQQNMQQVPLEQTSQHHLPDQQHQHQHQHQQPAVASAQDGLRSQLAPFLQKLYNMVDDHSLDHIISWSKQGDNLVVWDPNLLAKEVLPVNFKHNNFSSFVRQLHTYGFRKVDPDTYTFHNEFFIRGRPELLSNMKRRRKGHSTPAPPPVHAPGSAAANPGVSHPIPNSGLASVEIGNYGGGGGGTSASTQQQLERDKATLMMELVRMRQDQQEMMKELRATRDRQERTERNVQVLMQFLETMYNNTGASQGSIKGMMDTMFARLRANQAGGLSGGSSAAQFSPRRQALPWPAGAGAGASGSLFGDNGSFVSQGFGNSNSNSMGNTTGGSGMAGTAGTGMGMAGTSSQQGGLGAGGGGNGGGGGMATGGSGYGSVSPAALQITEMLDTPNGGNGGSNANSPGGPDGSGGNDDATSPMQMGDDKVQGSKILPTNLSNLHRSKPY